MSMTVRVVRLGSPRVSDEGLRIGTVRHPPRGVPKSEFASGNWYDLWFPNLAPSAALVKLGRSAATSADWSEFVRRYEREMAEPGPRHDIELLAVLSRAVDFSVGCYCEDPQRCHRSVLAALLEAAGGSVVRPATD
jgi:uncharacterized protein YeaO (DUF488 family)